MHAPPQSGCDRTPGAHAAGVTRLRRGGRMAGSAVARRRGRSRCPAPRGDARGARPAPMTSARSSKPVSIPGSAAGDLLLDAPRRSGTMQGLRPRCAVAGRTGRRPAIRRARAHRRRGWTGTHRAPSERALRAPHRGRSVDAPGADSRAASLRRLARPCTGPWTRPPAYRSASGSYTVNGPAGRVGDFSSTARWRPARCRPAASR